MSPIPMPNLRILTFALLAAAMLFMAWPVSAQITRTARIELGENTKELHFGADVYITFDKEKRLNEQIVATRHENNLRGARQDSDIINLGVDPGPTWLVFSITNNSKQEEWILDFGTFTEGRMGKVKKLVVKNHTRDESFVRALREDDKPESLGKSLRGTGIPVKISLQKSELFVVYIETEGNLPATFVPKLMSEHEQMNGFTAPKIAAWILIAFFIAAATFFAAAAYLEKKPTFGLFSAYYAMNMIMFVLLLVVFFIPFSPGGYIAALLYPTCFLIGIVMTWMFLDISAEDYSDNAVVLSLGSFIVVSSLIAAVLPDRSTIFNELLTFLPCTIGMLALAALAFSHAQNGKFAGYYLASGWLMVFFGSLLTLLSGAQIFGSNVILLNAYWISLVPQALFFAGGFSKKILEMREAERVAFSRENRAAQSLARLKQSKETADQARLLRVIERERELMAELREQEMQRTEEMRRAKEMADHANRAKSAFLAVVSHEIRTPMTGIMGILRLFRDTKLSKEQSDYLLTIQKSGDTMMVLLNDILDFEKIESGNMELEEIDFDLPKLVQGVVTLMAGHAADRNVMLHSDVPADFPVALMGDPTRLRQVLLNLVNNAIKFTENGSVTIRLRATRLENKKDGVKGNYEIYLAVEDTGIGISEKAQEKLFTPFEQADASVSRKYGGTGLGLAICRKLVTAMGGTISLSSQIGVGSTFFFSLLMKEGSAEASEESTLEDYATQDPVPSGPPLRLLVIEDNEINRKVLQNFLEKQHHMVSLADSGEMGLDIFGRSEFDAIFMDINLSGMSGVETAKVIRMMPDKRLAETPMIALTGNVDEEDVKSFHRAGFNAVMAKPIDYDQLIHLLGEVRKNKPAHGDSGSSAVPPSHEPQYEAQEEEIIAMPPPQYAQDDAVNKADEDVTPLHKFLQEQEQAPAEKMDFSTVFDVKMLDGLLRSLGKDQLIELLDGFIQKTDEIVAKMLAASAGSNNEGVYESAHELRGMAANFGMKELAAIANIIEKAMHNNQPEKAAPEIEKLPGAAETTKAAIRNWLS